MTDLIQNGSSIYQLVYVSTATILLELNDIHAIERVAIINNEKAGLTGALTYCDCKFMQFLEGQKSHVEQIFAAIKKDTRHHSIDVLRQDFIPERQFTDWHMKYTDVNEIHEKHGPVYHKIFDTQADTLSVSLKAEESISILMAFKNSCSEQFYTKHYDLNDR